MSAARTIGTAVLACASVAYGAVPTRYVVVDLGTAGDPDATLAPGSGAFDVNDMGTAVGFSVLADDGPDIHALAWEGTPIDLGTIPGLDQSRAYAVADNGDAVGVAYALGDLGVRALRWSGGAPVDLGAFSARDVNASGTIVGEINVDTTGLYTHAVRWSAGSLTDLGTLGGSQSSAYALNSAGDVVGSSFTGSDMKTRAFLWDGTMHGLGSLGGPSSQAYDVNDARQVVGVAQKASGERHAFLFEVNASGDVTSRTDLGVLGGGYSYAYGINESGDVVGTSDSRAFVWSEGVIVDLNERLADGTDWKLVRAWSINDVGQIAGEGVHRGQLRAFLLCPTTPADLDGNGSVGFADLNVLLQTWGPCPSGGADCPADLLGNGSVGFGDLTELLDAWGPVLSAGVCVP